MVKRGRVIAVLGVLVVGTVGSVAVVKGRPAWERHQVISALEDVPGVRSAELSSLSVSPKVVLDGDLEQTKVDETVKAVYEAADAQDLDSDLVYTTYRGIEIVFDGVSDTRWIEAGAVLAHQPGVSSGEATPGGRANVDGHWGKKEPYELSIAVGPSSSIDSIAGTIREAGFPGRIKITFWDSRGGGNGKYFGSFETTATSRASKFDPGLADDTRDLLTAWNATAP